MANFKIKSFCKINLFLRVVKKLKNGYHNIKSLVAFCDLHDVITISKIKGKEDKISFSGKFKKGINKKFNTITRTLYLLRKENLLLQQFYKINIKKNIPHGSGLGGGSSNAADLLNYFTLRMKLRKNNKKVLKIASKVGFDVPISLDNKYTYLTGKKNKIIKLKKNFKLYILIVYPNLICSTKKIYKQNKTISRSNNQKINTKNKINFIRFLKNEKNDLEKIVVKLHPKIKKIIDIIQAQKGCYFSRITGSGSACIGIFTNMKAAIYSKKTIKLKFPKCWSVVSKTI